VTQALEPAATGAAGARAEPRREPRRSRRARWPLAVGAILALALGLRLWGIAYGLPFAYYGDENAHFVPVAIRFFEHGLNPHYFVNPPGYTELLYVVFGVRYGFDGGAVQALLNDPGSVFLTARLVSAVLGVLSVWFLYLAGARLLDRRVGLLAAGILAVAFVPVFYAHQALNDAPSLAPLTLSLLGTALVLRRGRVLDWALAGAALGVAAGVKYTCGIAAIPLAAAAAVRLATGPRRPVLIGIGVAAVATVVGFFVTNPYAFADVHTFRRDLHRQSVTASHRHPGQTQYDPLSYYGWVMTWGFGWVPSLAAVAGAALLARARRAVALVLVPAPLIMIAVLSREAVAWARYIVPAMPYIAVLAAYAGARLAGMATRWRPAVWAAVAVALCGQGLFTVIHNDRVLARADTRNVTRTWLLSHLPPGTKVVTGPIMAKHRPEVGLSWLSPRPRAAPALAERPVAVWSKYERTLQPGLLDRYAREGYCWVVTASTRAALAFVGPGRRAAAIAYYRALERRARLAFRASPFAPGAPVTPGREQVRFQWDWSYDYYPPAFRRPGPVMSVYRLTNGACRS
jgi:Dolichyl-phosphate-mannose-protein mannosyltransferase